MAERSIATVLAASADLSGNWSWTVWLLIPLVLLLAYVTARCVGPLGDPPRSRSASRGVSHYLDNTISQKDGE
jgi:membrane protein implicated in regulation of membrane protease activity